MQVSLEVSQHVQPELGIPWLSVYLPVKSCHIILKDKTGTFSPPSLNRIETNNWCNWTIWAGPHKHILIYIEGFEGKSNCDDSQDRILFQGILSSTENKVVYACRNHGMLIFATQAVAVYVVFLSEASSQNQSHKHFKGRYYIFEDYVNSTNGEKSVLKSNSHVASKSYVLPTGHSLNSTVTTQMLGQENWLPVTNEKIIKTGTETFSKLAVGKHMHVSLLKSTKTVSLNPFDLKRRQVTKSSIDNSRILNKSPTLLLDSNDAENEEETFTQKPDVYSTFLDMTHNLQMMTKLEATKNHGAITESVTPQNDGQSTTRWMTTHMKGTEGENKNATTFPQVSLEEQRIPVQSLKSIPTKMQKQMLQMLLPNSEVSKKKADPTESPPHLEQTKIYKGEQTGIQVSTAQNGNTAVRITVSQGIKASPSKSTMETKFHQTSTLASTDRHPTPSLRSFNDYLMSISTTVNPQAMPSNCLMRTQINTAFTTQYKNSVNKNREYLQKKRTKTTPLYSSSSWLPTSSILLKVKNKSYETNPGFRSHENYFVLNSQHKPGDLLFEIIFEIEYKGQLPPVGSTLEKAFIDSIKHQVQERVKLFSNEIKEFKLKEIIMRKEEIEMDRQNGPNLIFAFWLHLTSEEKNISYLLNFQLEDLSGAFVGAGKVQTVLVRDVNECNSGIDLCGNEAICLNGDGTYSCQCKEGYEDRSLTKLGTLCVRHPRSGLDSLYSYTEFIVGITVFCITVFVVVISVLCTIIKKRRIKKDMRVREAALPGMPAEPQRTTFDHNNIRQLLTLDPAQLKVRAKQPELPLQLRTGPSETYRVSIEQSERL
ncbi:uncharacterized protein LOC120307828 [Crotalus tigris]|uniref:uncharacterized protein LOC120307828 n=1 Tax=Crotalus tigris TaxID=88082 RepID=UPI00192F8CA4|nr:uncharacterized protein LOC120307828 [Crotalus tigris]XP_039198916.1 uncharacterized protein LOC120307828 [Crotalus tigris]